MDSMHRHQHSKGCLKSKLKSLPGFKLSCVNWSCPPLTQQLQNNLGLSGVKIPDERDIKKGHQGHLSVPPFITHFCHICSWEGHSTTHTPLKLTGGCKATQWFSNKIPANQDPHMGDITHGQVLLTIFKCIGTPNPACGINRKITDRLVWGLRHWPLTQPLLCHGIPLQDACSSGN